MKHVAGIVELMDLAWWPDMLQSVSKTEDDSSSLSNSLSSKLKELAAIVQSDEADALEELTLP